jgi:NAD(P)-dependent dehydrogenase (short-subunit alcohol dehydrogenase family)
MAEESEPKVALVTGAGRGLGRALALKLAGEGFVLAITARSFEDLEETRRLSGFAPRDALIVLADLGDDDAPEQVFGATLDHFGRLDVLINAAHFTGPTLSLADLEGVDQDRLLAVNLRAPIALARMACRQMRDQYRVSAIINFARIVESPADPVTAAILAFSRAAATELSTDKIRITAITVGLHDISSAAENAMAFIRDSRERYPIAVTLED